MTTPTAALTKSRLFPMRPRDPNEPGRTASSLELFFDLVFVVAVSIAAAELHRAFSEAHIIDGLIAYTVVFFGIWWIALCGAADRVVNAAIPLAVVLILLDPILPVPFAIAAVVMTLVVAVLVLHPPVPEHALEVVRERRRSRFSGGTSPGRSR
ncbi:low temperature requirement protein A [Kribbella sp. NBC_00709]|uniref:low temperature requirement protein A n=1 Tax=Kribbella sp. NBC_00709 TaxID=2975972 RepID=UPI002E296F1F|nr:low temperature requirement protein A [Kribbella sp. NBC_00709]